jgi:hypothetical protein
MVLVLSLVTRGISRVVLAAYGQNSVYATPRLDFGLGHGAFGSGLRDLVPRWKQLEMAVGWQHVLRGVVFRHLSHLVGCVDGHAAFEDEPEELFSCDVVVCQALVVFGIGTCPPGPIHVVTGSEGFIPIQIG